MDIYRALIVDDEVNNSAILQHFVTTYCRNVDVIGQAASVAEAISEINSQQPDIIFLDIRLNEGDAFDILDKVENIKAQVIFVTSYNEYAIKAFKYNAVDYILKPILIEDVVLSVNKAIKNIEQKQYFDFQKNILSKDFPSLVTENKDYLAIPSVDSVDLVRTNHIVYIEADNKYTILHTTTEGKKYISSKNLQYFESIADPLFFFRIHHSYIVNIQHLIRILKRDGCYCEMAGGILLPISKRKQDDFNIFLKIKN
ncbi:Sensory transduction protein LytR [compost metagenome]